MVSCTASKRIVSNRSIEVVGGDGLNSNVIPQEVTEYFKMETPKITKVIANDNYTLTITFNNYEVRLYDLSKSLFGVFEILKDKDKFREVFIDASGNLAWDKDKNIDSNVVWSNRIDICKDAAYMGSDPTRHLSENKDNR